MKLTKLLYKIAISTCILLCKSLVSCQFLRKDDAIILQTNSLNKEGGISGFLELDWVNVAFIVMTLTTIFIHICKSFFVEMIDSTFLKSFILHNLDKSLLSQVKSSFSLQGLSEMNPSTIALVEDVKHKLKQIIQFKAVKDYLINELTKDNKQNSYTYADVEELFYQLVVSNDQFSIRIKLLWNLPMIVSREIIYLVLKLSVISIYCILVSKANLPSDLNSTLRITVIKSIIYLCVLIVMILDIITLIAFYYVYEQNTVRLEVTDFDKNVLSCLGYNKSEDQLTRFEF